MTLKGQTLLMNGLYDGEFVGFKIASSEEVDSALRDAVVAIDANVLLDLYRFRPQTSRDLIKTLKSLGDRLVVPHQALREFWRRRQRSQDSPRGATKAAADALAKSGRSIRDTLTTWARAVGVDDGELSDLTARVDGFVENLKDELQRVLEDADAERGGADPILAQLEEILEGRVTSPLEHEEWSTCIAEANRRIEAEEPPGYIDAAKRDSDLPEGGAGDYLVWYQAIHYSKEQGRDLLIITRDQKEDWWWRQQLDFIGPRPELTLEFNELTGRRLFLLRPADLLTRASVLEVEVDQESPADAGRVADSEEQSAEPWTLSALAALLERLDEEAPVQAAALRLATPGQDGRVSRDKVYELGSYGDDRMLRGFTRPYRRLTEALQREGIIPARVSPIFVAQYPDGVKTSYFSVPSEVPQLLEELSG
jgi:hypothetical protein